MLGFGIIGAGDFGKHYIRLINEIEETVLEHIAVRSLDALTIDPKYVSYRVKNSNSATDLIKDPAVECVVIATPATTHFEIAREALIAGKHVLVEKPMVMNLDEAYRLKDVVDRSKKVFMVGHQYLYNEHIGKLKRELKKGTLGKIRYLLAEQRSLGPVWSDSSCVWERATHEFSILDYLFESSSVNEIISRTSSVVEQNQGDFNVTTVTFETGLMATIITSWFAPERIRKITIGGDKGFVLFDDYNADCKLKFFKQLYPQTKSESGTKASPFVMRDEDIIAPKVRDSEPLKNQLLHFVHCVQNDKTPRSDIKHGIRVTEYLDRASTKSNTK